jgi:hypothetical protein
MQPVSLSALWSWIYIQSPNAAQIRQDEEGNTRSMFVFRFNCVVFVLVVAELLRGNMLEVPM